MKKIILLLAVVLGMGSLTASAGWYETLTKRPGQLETPNPPVEVVVEVPGKTQAQLFTAAKTWAAETRLMTIGSSDKEAGWVAGACIASNVSVDVQYDVRIDVKDGKFRVTASNYKTAWHGGADHAFHYIQTKSELEDATGTVKDMADTFFAYASKQVSSDKW